jgi:hypothetical protein
MCQLIFPFQPIAPQAHVSPIGPPVHYFPLSTPMVILFAVDRHWHHLTDMLNASRALDMGAVASDLSHARFRMLLALCDPLYSAGLGFRSCLSIARSLINMLSQES